MSSVSVIIPAYNQGHYLREAVQSVLDQTYPDFEVIVVDDGSTDNTAEIAQSFSDPRINYVFQENRGLSGARNTGICHATGNYLSYLDADDVFLPEKLALLVSTLDADAEIGLVAGQAIPINERGEHIGKIYKTALPQEPANLLLNNPLHVGSVLLRREWQEKAGYFDERLRSYEDWDMWLRLVRLGCKTGWVAKPVSLYRFHTAQMTRNSAQMTEATFAVLEKVYNDPDLPEDWHCMRDAAYSNAHLRAAASYFSSQDYTTGRFHLLQAVDLNPDLMKGNAEQLARHFRAMADSPKNPDPLAFLENIYNHLPGDLRVLQNRRNQDLSQVAIQRAFEEFQKNNYFVTRSYIWRAIRYQPRWALNRGVLSIFLRSSYRTFCQF